MIVLVFIAVRWVAKLVPVNALDISRHTVAAYVKRSSWLGGSHSAKVMTHVDTVIEPEPVQTVGLSRVLSLTTG